MFKTKNLNQVIDALSSMEDQNKLRDQKIAVLESKLDSMQQTNQQLLSLMQTLVKQNPEPMKEVKVTSSPTVVSEEFSEMHFKFPSQNHENNNTFQDLGQLHEESHNDDDEEEEEEDDDDDQNDHEDHNNEDDDIMDMNNNTNKMVEDDSISKINDDSKMKLLNLIWILIKF